MAAKINLHIATDMRLRSWDTGDKIFSKLLCYVSIHCLRYSYNILVDSMTLNMISKRVIVLDCYVRYFINLTLDSWMPLIT